MGERLTRSPTRRLSAPPPSTMRHVAPPRSPQPVSPQTLAACPARQAAALRAACPSVPRLRSRCRRGHTVPLCRGRCMMTQASTPRCLDSCLRKVAIVGACTRVDPGTIESRIVRAKHMSGVRHTAGMGRRPRWRSLSGAQAARARTPSAAPSRLRNCRIIRQCHGQLQANRHEHSGWRDASASLRPALFWRAQ